MRARDKDRGENDTELIVLERIKGEGEEKNFAFGTTDQSNSHRKAPLMRAEKKGGGQGESEKKRRKEGYGTPFLHRK